MHARTPVMLPYLIAFAELTPVLRVSTQMFQMSVCVNSGRVNALLERGEALIQRSEPADAQDVERRLQELLLLCSGVFHRIGRLHTRLLSMRLV